MAKFINLRTFLSYLVLLAIILGVITIQTLAMYFQYFLSEIPCPLCLLERLCFIGVALGSIYQIKNPHKYTGYGMLLLYALVLELIGARQSLLDICPRPGHDWIGTAILGLHMPIWSFIFGLLFTLGIAINYLLFETENKATINNYPLLNKLFNYSLKIIILITIINVISVIIQCGPYICHTYGYYLLTAFS